MCKINSPFQHNGDGDCRVPLEAVNDIWSLVPIYPLDGLAVNHLRGATHGVVQSELGLLLSRHAGQLLLHTLQDTDGGQVGLQNHIQLWKHGGKKGFFFFHKLYEQ